MTFNQVVAGSSPAWLIKSVYETADLRFLFFHSYEDFIRMSFTSDVKKEIFSHENSARHCMLAELAAYFICCAEWRDGDFVLNSDNRFLTERISRLLDKTYGKSTVDRTADRRSGSSVDPDNIPAEIFVNKEKISFIFSSVKFSSNDDYDIPQDVPGILLKNSCCRRAVLTAWFLCLGSVSDPEKNYHCEYVCVSEEQAAQMISLLKDFDITAHRTVRKGRVVVYIKESESIAELLNVIGAHKALMHLENLRIEKGLRNDVNRAVNCDAANAKKVAATSGRQIADITFLRDNIGLDNLPDNLGQMALVRLENPDLSLKDLGELLDPPIGKSGVNHRLRKLSELAEEYRNK